MPTKSKKSHGGKMSVPRALSIIFEEASRRSNMDREELANTLGFGGLSAHSNLIKASSAAELLGLSPSTLANWRTSGTRNLRFTRIGSRVFYSREDLMNFISRNSKTSTSEEVTR